MTETGIGADAREIKRHLRDLESKAPSVISRAINRTITNIKKNIAQQIGGTKGEYNIQSGEVKKTLKSDKATAKRLNGYVASNGSPILLSKFNAKIKPGPMKAVSYSRGKPSPGFYSAAVKKRGGKKALQGSQKAFLGKSEKAGGLIFLQRFSNRSYPLKPLYGPAVPKMIGNEEIMASIKEEAESTLQKRIGAEIENILRRGQA